MVAAAGTEGPPSLTGVTVRRGLTMGRLYLVIGAGLSMFYSAVLAALAGPAFVSVIPLLLPIFCVMGSMGGLMVFTNDRMKGVLEYLLAYGYRPRRIFVDVLVACFVQLTIVIGASLAVGIGVYVGAGNGVTWVLVRDLVVYTIPMSFAAAAFSATVGMFWTSLSSPRAGINSPIGIVPIIGMAPPVAALLGAEAAPRFGVAIALGVLLAVALAVFLLIGRIDQLMPRERLLSPA